MKNTSPRYASNTASPGRTGGSSASAPAKTLRLGRLKAAIWENTSDQRTFFNVTFTRSYLDEQKQWHDADSFGRDDLLLLAKLADQAHSFICERLTSPRNDE